MDRDWKADQARVEREYNETKAAMDEAFQAIKPGTAQAMTNAAGLATYNEAKDRFEEAQAHRSVFDHEHAAYIATR